ncbi:HNH endonuclease [Streptomyces sp. LN785]|uniref:HNH endonuclease n=1 Tax=Streptomyces sp. LN785 TaxID=3112983 RepID=UPI003719A4E7
MDAIEGAAKRFAEHAIRSEVHVLNPLEFRPEGRGLGTPLKITTNDLSKKLYDQRMAKLGSPGRGIYDLIKLAPKNGLCPLCGVRKVGTLDHYLPRASYSALSVTPLNLIPACSECNRFKHDKHPTKEEEQTFNPYVDDVTESRWLIALTEEGAPATVQFSVGSPTGWSNALIARARYHFDVYKLGELYSHHATSEISGIRRLLRQIYSLQGNAGVRTYLKDCEGSAREHDMNSWKAAMFAALADNEWYCGGGFDVVAF